MVFYSFREVFKGQRQNYQEARGFKESVDGEREGRGRWNVLNSAIHLRLRPSNMFLKCLFNPVVKVRHRILKVQLCNFNFNVF